MTKREAIELTHQENRLMQLGIDRSDAEQLRRISMTLRRWFERECGSDHGGCIERDDTTDKPFWHSSFSGAKWAIPDREKGARKRLTSLMATYPTLTAYVQGDPRGCALYILTSDQLASDHGIDSIYTRGVAIA